MADPENQRWLEKGEKTRWMGMDTGEVAVGNVECVRSRWKCKASEKSGEKL